MLPFPLAFNTKAAKLEKKVKEAHQVVDQAMEMINDEDLFQKAFLKPIEVSLKKTGPGLPTGLNLVLKDDPSANKYQLTNFQAPTKDELRNMSYEQIIEKNYDNLLSLMKSENNGIQLAICVCMYSQDKKMLKSTLAGISENIDFLVRSDISTDQIAVFVVMDGIEKVDPSVVEYFDELERESNIMLNNDAQPVGLHDFLYCQKTPEEKYQEEINNINNILFTPAELFDRQERRFQTRVAEYLSVRELSNLSEKLKTNQGLTYDVLDPRIQKFFVEVAKERRKEEFGEDEDQLKDKDVNFFLQHYANDVIKSRPIIREALNKAKTFCDEYISTRDPLAIMNYFRTGVFAGKKYQAAHKDGNQIVYEDEEERIHDERIKASKMNLFLCTRYKNSGKLASHNWFFNGFCNELKPRYAVLLDVGLRPQKNSLYKMYQYMKKNQNVGGVCGYMGLRIERVQDQLGYNEELDEQEDMDFISRLMLKVVDIQRAQQMQYHFAHLIDKPFESQFDFIHVLPGAFSAYNMKALERNSLLEQYFKSIQQKIHTTTLMKTNYSALDIVMKTAIPQFIYYWLWPLEENSQEQLLYNQNIYLAEDRILCMGIHKNQFDMAFIPDAYAWVDPIKNVHTLLGQRKRWINGSFFAFQKVKKQLANQEVVEVALRFQMYFLTFMNTMAYIAPALYLFTVSIAMQVFKSDFLMKYFQNIVPTEAMDGLVYLINFVYVMMITGVIFYSMHLTNKHKKFIPLIYATTSLLGIFAVIVFLILAVDIVRGSKSFLIENEQFIRTLPFDKDMLDSMRYMILAIIGLYTIPVVLYSILFRKFSFAIDIVFSALSFMYFSPTYLNTLNIYALCRINDISWGTKGLDANMSSKNTAIEESWKVIRLIHVGKYFFWNIIASMLLLTLGGSYVSRFFVTFFIMLLLSITMFTKVSIGCYYIMKYYFNHRIQDPDIGAPVNTDSKVDNLFQVAKPQIIKNVKNNIESIIKDIEEQFKKNSQSDKTVMWGGKSKILAPGKKKQALKRGFSQLKKQNQSRVIRRDPITGKQEEFQLKYRTSKSKDSYRKRKDDLSADGKDSENQMKMRLAPSKDKYKKKDRSYIGGGQHDVVELKGADNNSSMKEKIAQSKDKYRKNVSPIKNDEIKEDKIKDDGMKERPAVDKNKYKKTGKK